jgi:hypothetical protein
LCEGSARRVEHSAWTTDKSPSRCLLRVTRRVACEPLPAIPADRRITAGHGGPTGGSPAHNP